MQKKFLAAILAAAMLLSMLTGCQNRSTQVPLRFSGIPDIMDTIHPRQRSQCALAGFPFRKSFLCLPHAKIFSAVQHLQPYNFRRHIFAECFIVFHEKNGGLELKQQFLDLHPGDDIDIVHWLVPNVQVRRFTDGLCQQNLFLLSGA